MNRKWLKSTWLLVVSLDSFWFVPLPKKCIKVTKNYFVLIFNVNKQSNFVKKKNYNFDFHDIKIKSFELSLYLVRSLFDWNTILSSHVSPLTKDLVWRIIYFISHKDRVFTMSVGITIYLRLKMKDSHRRASRRNKLQKVV